MGPQMQAFARRLGREFIDSLLPRFAVVHARTGTIAGVGKTEADALCDASDSLGEVPGGLWRVEPCPPNYLSRRMDGAA